MIAAHNRPGVILESEEGTMRRVDKSQVQFRSRPASPFAYTVAIPLVEALLASLGVAVVIGLVRVWVFGAGLISAATTAAGVFVLLAAVLLAVRFGRAVIHGLELATGVDIDGDDVIGPDPEPEPRFVYVKRGSGRRSSHDDDLADFVRGCYTRGTGRRAWGAARLATTNHKLTKGMWQKFTGIMLKAGVLEDLGPGNGTELTCELEEALEVLGLE